MHDGAFLFHITTYNTKIFNAIVFHHIHMIWWSLVMTKICDFFEILITLSTLEFDLSRPRMLSASVFKKFVYIHFFDNHKTITSDTNWNRLQTWPTCSRRWERIIMWEVRFWPVSLWTWKHGWKNENFSGKKLIFIFINGCFFFIVKRKQNLWSG